MVEDGALDGHNNTLRGGKGGQRAGAGSDEAGRGGDGAGGRAGEVVSVLVTKPLDVRESALGVPLGGLVRGCPSGRGAGTCSAEHLPKVSVRALQELAGLPLDDAINTIDNVTVVNV